jgi:integrase
MKSRDLKDSELTLILDQMTSLRDRALFIVGIKTGFRISELLSLRIEDVSQEDGSIRDTLTVHRRNMKGKRQSRTIPLHPLAKQALQSYLKTGVVGKLFPMTRQHAWRVIKEASRKARLSGTVSTHSMRKTFGMNVYLRTEKNVVAAQKALGHASLASTTHYLSIGQDEVDAAILA